MIDKPVPLKENIPTTVIIPQAKSPASVMADLSPC
jgi:hypothetical protein